MRLIDEARSLLRGVRSGLERSPLGGLLESQDGALYLSIAIVPLLLYALYIGLVRSSGYVSEAQMVIERDAMISAPSLDLGIFSMPNTSLTDALVIKEYIRSRAMLESLDAELDLRGHYADDRWDPISRLDRQASKEDFLKFYRKRVDVRVDGESMIISLKVEAYTPEFAQAMATAIVRRAENFVNEISHALAREQMAFVQSELEGANRRLREASDRLVALQKKNELLSPEIETVTLGNIIATLQAELASRRAELSTLRSYLNDTAPEVVAARKRITALEQQIERERAKQVGIDSQGLSELALDYQAAQMAVKVAADAYQIGLKTLETARLDASRKAKHLVQVSGPGLPDEALVPRRAYSIFTAAVLLHLLYFVVTLVVATVRDHRD